MRSQKIRRRGQLDGNKNSRCTVRFARASLAQAPQWSHHRSTKGTNSMVFEQRFWETGPGKERWQKGKKGRCVANHQCFRPLNLFWSLGALPSGAGVYVDKELFQDPRSCRHSSCSVAEKTNTEGFSLTRFWNCILKRFVV